MRHRRVWLVGWFGIAAALTLVLDTFAKPPSRPRAATAKNVSPAAFAEIRTPSDEAPRSIGSAASGCIAGAAPLPLEGDGYQVVRVSRRRYYGHPRTVRYVEELARASRAAGIATLYIGDLSQPRGGPMSSGHSSHQTGLDIDIWLNLEPKPELSADQRETVSVDSMLDARRDRVDPQRWTPQHEELIALAARAPEVERIFVNPALKVALCRSAVAATDRGWLRKVRPWWGHDAHFHVRVRCPSDSPTCQPGPEIPPGDGCGAELASWLTPKKPPAKPKDPSLRRVPAECHRLLRE